MSSGRWCVTYEFVLATWKLKASGFFRKQPAGEEDNAQQDVNAVIGLAEM
jgi:hypothetical protein